MLILITGQPGAGKTLYALQFVQKMAADGNRPVFYSGIKDLALPWTEIDPTQWPKVPDGSIVVIDECQRVFRPRMHGSDVPKHVSELETHRHRGIDIVLITQHPMLLDANARRLVGLHFHVVRKFGFQASTIHEWSSVKENCDKNREGSQRHEWSYPKDLYQVYKSAEIHTHKARLPMRLVLLVVAVIAIPVFIWYAYRTVQHKGESKAPAVVSAAGAASMPGGLPLGVAAGAESHLTTSQYLETLRPRLPGLEFTAIRYDDVTKPVRAPYPAACVATASRCSCYSQQGTVLDVADQLCRALVTKGFFKDWQDQDERDAMAQRDRGSGGDSAPGRPEVSGADRAISNQPAAAMPAKNGNARELTLLSALEPDSRPTDLGAVDDGEVLAGMHHVRR